jgi:DNA-directed RNA polymerase subunit omega
MMLYPPMGDLVEKVGSRYLLVNLVARRARQISADADDNHDILMKKPVSSAIDEIYAGRLAIRNAPKK